MPSRRAMMAMAWLSAAGLLALAGLGALDAEASADLQTGSGAVPDTPVTGLLAANAVDYESLSTDEEAPGRITLFKRSRKGAMGNARRQPTPPSKRQRLPSVRARQAAMDAAESTSEDSAKLSTESSDTGSEFSAESIPSSALTDDMESLTDSSNDDQGCVGSPKGARCTLLKPIAWQPPRASIIETDPETPVSPDSVQYKQSRAPNRDLTQYRHAPIAAVQSKFYRSPFEGNLVVVKGVVTAIRPRKRFRQQANSPKPIVQEVMGTFFESKEPHVVFLQAPDNQWDLDHRTSEALMVRLAPVSYTEGYANVLVPGGLAVGDTIEVYGKVAEERYDSVSLLQTVITQVVRVNNVHRMFRTGGSTVSPSLGETAVRRLAALGVTPVTLNAPRTIPAGLPPQAFNQPTRQIFGPDPFDLTEPKQRIEDLTPPLKLKPSERGIDFFKALEHMMIRIRAPVVLGPLQYGSVVVLADGGKHSNGLVPNGPLVAMARNSSAGLWVATYPERLEIAEPLDGTLRPVVNAGDRLDDIVGIVSYSFGRYQVVPFTAYNVVAVAPGQVERIAAAQIVKYSVPAGGCRPLRVVSYNVENLYGKQHQRIGTLASQLVSDLGMPDIVALQEVQDADGPENNQTLSADETLAKIVAAMRVATDGRVEYGFLQIDPEFVNGDGGQPFGNIRPAFLYRRDTVQLAPSAAGRAGSPAESVQIVHHKRLGGTALSVNPGRVGPHMEAFNKTRKPLAAAFDIVGAQVRAGGASKPPKRVFVVNVHLSSKMGSSPTHSSLQPPINGAVKNRIEQVHVLNKFRDELMAVAANSGAAAPHLLIIGDMNEASHAPPLRQFALPSADPSGALVPVMDSLPEMERYSYVFGGLGQLIDHIFATRALASRLRYVRVLHVNTPFANDAPSRYVPPYSPSGLAGSGGPLRKDAGDESDASFSSLSAPANPRRIVRVVRRPAKSVSVDEIEPTLHQRKVDLAPRRGTKRRADDAADISSDAPERAGSRKAPRRESFWTRVVERVHSALHWFMPVETTPAAADSAQPSANARPRLVRRGGNLRITVPRPATAASNLAGSVSGTPLAPEAPAGRRVVSDHDPLVADFDLCR